MSTKSSVSVAVSLALAFNVVVISEFFSSGTCHF